MQLSRTVEEFKRRLSALENRMEAIDNGATGKFHTQVARAIESPYLDAKEAAAYLKITVKALYGLKERGRLKPLSGSRKLRFTKEMLDEYVKGTSR